jgi:hypothetical protein
MGLGPTDVDHDGVSRARQVRIEGQHLFPDPVKDSSPRHRWGARTLTREIGHMARPTKPPSRLSGQRRWAFQLHDLVDNEIGIWEALLGKDD